MTRVDRIIVTAHIMSPLHFRVRYKRKMDVDQAFFVCKCRGIKFYQLYEVHARDFTNLVFVRNPSNSYDKYCVEVRLRSSSGPKIGHVESSAAAKLSPLLLEQGLSVVGYVLRY